MLARMPPTVLLLCLFLPDVAQKKEGFLWSSRSFFPVSTAILCSSLEAGPVVFPRLLLMLSSSPFLTLSHTSSSPYFQEEVYRRTVALLLPIPHLSPPFLHLTVLVMTTHLFYPDPTLVPFPYFLSSSFLSSPHPVLPPLPPLHPHALSTSRERWALYCTLPWHWKLHSLDLY